MYKVIVVEDEDIIRKGLIQSIDWKSLECRVIAEASNGKEALHQVDSFKPDIIILDINMPVMNGIEFLQNIPSDLYSVIIISGHSEFEYAKKAIDFGVTEYLLKPVDHDELKQALLNSIENLKMKRLFLEQTQEQEHPYVALDIKTKVDSITLTMIMNYIDENYDQKITLNDLSDLTNKSSTSINSRFQRELKMTFSEYLTRYRIQKAIEFIATLSFHLYEIAEKTGFRSYKYFNQVFKKTIGVSPQVVETYYLRKK